jgi:hypothetical protein
MEGMMALTYAAKAKAAKAFERDQRAKEKAARKAAKREAKRQAKLAAEEKEKE